MSGPMLPAPAARAALPADRFMAGVEALDIDRLIGRIGPPELDRAARELDRIEAEAAVIQRAAARLFATDDGSVVLEHLLDVTLRDMTMLDGAPRDVAFDAALRREGAKGLACLILRLIHDGRGLPVAPPKSPPQETP